MTIDTLVTAYINSTHGWAVSEQFEATFSGGESFEEQNHNALRFIHQCVKDIVDSGLFANEVIDELDDYSIELSKYLKEAK